MMITQTASQTTSDALTRLHADLRDYRFRCEFVPGALLGVILAEGDSGKWYAIRYSRAFQKYSITGTEALLFTARGVLEFLEDN